MLLYKFAVTSGTCMHNLRHGMPNKFKECTYPSNCAEPSIITNRWVRIQGDTLARTK